MSNQVIMSKPSFNKAFSAVKSTYNQFEDQACHAWCRKLTAILKDPKNAIFTSGQATTKEDLAQAIRPVIVAPCTTEAAKEKAENWVQFILENMETA